MFIFGKQFIRVGIISCANCSDCGFALFLGRFYIVRAYIPRGAFGEQQTFQKRIRGKPVGAVHSVTAVQYSASDLTPSPSLALNPDEYSDSFDVKATKSEAYANTPCLFRIKGDKSLKKAKELIALLMTDYGVMYVKTNHSIYAMPYEDDDALVAKGLARKD